MDFQTKVELPADLPPVSHAERILLMGSCFVENTGRLPAENKFRIDMDPLGIPYSPLPVSTALVEILKGKVYQERDLFLYKERWHSSMHHGLLSVPLPEEVLEKINTHLPQAHRPVHELDWLMLTFDTAYVYEQKETRQVVSSYHKLPESCLNRRILSIDEIASEYASLVTNMVVCSSRLKALFMASPIRRIRDGMYVNQLSKLTSLFAIDHLQQLFPDHVLHFPSYEIVLDELRDYRHYADDMLHPSPLAIRYLWERLSEAFFSVETKRVITATEDIAKDSSHKPFHPESEAYQRFLGQTVLEIERLSGKYLHLDFQKETELCHIRLNP